MSVSSQWHVQFEWQSRKKKKIHFHFFDYFQCWLSQPLTRVIRHDSIFWAQTKLNSQLQERLFICQIMYNPFQYSPSKTKEVSTATSRYHYFFNVDIYWTWFLEFCSDLWRIQYWKQLYISIEPMQWCGIVRTLPMYKLHHKWRGGSWFLPGKKLYTRSSVNKTLSFSSRFSQSSCSHNSVEVLSPRQEYSQKSKIIVKAQTNPSIRKKRPWPSAI